MTHSVLTLGTFDGVHLGHQALLRKVVARARALRAKSIALSFGMPPRHAGENLLKSVLLTTLPEKLKRMKSLGIHQVHVLTFDRKTASTLPEDFFRDTILKKLKAREMVVGPRVAFGRNRSGRLGLLKALGKSHGVNIHVVSSVAGGKEPVSSRRIRSLLWRGQVDKANTLLGYPYSVTGKVIHGDHRGQRLGFPTANIQVQPEKILPPGVFYVKVLPGPWDALCNVGVRPTFTPQEKKLHCEVFILGKEHRRPMRLYGRSLQVLFLRRIRGEKRFKSAAALQRQIAQDVRFAQKASQLYKKSHFSI